MGGPGNPGKISCVIQKNLRPVRLDPCAQAELDPVQLMIRIRSKRTESDRNRVSNPGTKNKNNRILCIGNVALAALT